VDAVAAPDGRGQLMLVSAFFEGRKHTVEPGDQKITCAAQLNGKAGVENI